MENEDEIEKDINFPIEDLEIIQQENDEEEPKPEEFQNIEEQIIDETPTKTKLSIIKCKRGACKNDRIIVKDKMNNEYYCSIPKETFDILPDMRPVEVSSKDSNRTQKKFIKSFLSYVKEV
jgi:hypothetical protein